MTPTSSDTVRASMEKGWQLPAYVYSDPEVFELEKKEIFNKGWIFVAMMEKFSEVGSYVTATLGDIPVVITKDAHGELNGLVNACLHRLHPVATGEGCARILQCKYHGWTYGLDGQLKTAPRSQNDPDFDRKSMALPTIRVEAFGDFVFANASADAPALHDYLGRAPQLVSDLRLSFSGWDHAGHFSYDVDANWKLFMENSLECYHCDLVHHDTFGRAIATDPDNYICDNYENVLTQVAPIQHAPLAEQRESSELEDFRLLYVWPSTAFSVDEYAGAITRLIPLGPKSCRFVVDVYSRPGVDPEIMQSWLEMYDSTFNEDKIVVAAQQAGYDSGRVAQGRLLPQNESSIAMFQQRTWTALEEELSKRGVSS
ncbi:MAG: aromatic ring-hydroxylating oxygenase subunit alpha [Salinibacterium amurskyense]